MTARGFTRGQLSYNFSLASDIQNVIELLSGIKTRFNGMALTGIAKPALSHLNSWTA